MNALSFHQVREAIAGASLDSITLMAMRILQISEQALSYRQIWKLLQPLLFWMRDTKDINVLDLYKAPPNSVINF